MKSLRELYRIGLGPSSSHTMGPRFAALAFKPLTAGASREQKARLVAEVTDSLVRVLGKKPEHTHIVIQEIAEENWGFAGLLTDDWKRRQG